MILSCMDNHYRNNNNNRNNIKYNEKQMSQQNEMHDIILPQGIIYIYIAIKTLVFMCFL